MYVRLAFAVAAHLEPEPERWGCEEDGCRRQARRALQFGKSANQILIVDEVLAVGFRFGERYSSE